MAIGKSTLRSRRRSDTMRSRPVRGISVPKVPRLIQDEIDRLVEKGKRLGLTTGERRKLDEALEFLDRMTILALEHANVRDRPSAGRRLPPA